MSFTVIVASAAIVAAFPVAWWAVATTRQPAARAVARNLSGGTTVVDLHQANLERSARERTVQPAVRALAQRGRRLTPVGMIESLERRMVTAAVGDWGIERVLAAKFGLGLGGGLLGFLFFTGNPGPATTFVLVTFVACGYFGPDVIISRRAQERQSAVQLELPDTIDQITISVEAGLGFEAALSRAARTGDGVLAEEISRMLQDVQLGVPRTDALRRLAERTDVTDLRRFVQAIAQAEGYGVPIVSVLRSQASELRERRRQRAEERAMKIPVKIVLPLVFCILPTLFIIVIGPAAVRIMRGGLGG